MERPSTSHEMTSRRGGCGKAPATGRSAPVINASAMIAEGSGAGAGVVAKGEVPEEAGETKNEPGRRDEVEHEPKWLAERLDQYAGGDIGDDDDRDEPAEDETEQARVDNVRVAGDVEEIEIAVNQSLSTNDPEADGSERDHDGVVNSDAEADGDEVKRDVNGLRSKVEASERN
jgi:hypothetical protein